MTSVPRTAPRSPTPEEFSHLSFGGRHHQETMSEPPHTGATLPFLLSSPPGQGSPGRAGHHSGKPSPTLGYVVEDLPHEHLLYSAGRPLLDHYRLAGSEAVDTTKRFYVPSAARSTRYRRVERSECGLRYFRGFGAYVILGSRETNIGTQPESSEMWSLEVSRV